MNYTLKWYYLGEFTQDFSSDNSSDNLLDDVKEWFSNNRPFEGTMAYLYDGAGNLIAEIY